MKSTKHCWDCKETKDVTLFSKQLRSKDGLQSRCKECDKKDRNRTKEKRLKYNKKYYAENKEYLLKQKKEYVVKNKEKVLLKNLEYYYKNKSILKEKRRNYARIKEAEKRAIKLNATPKWLSKEHKKCIKLEYQLAEWCTQVTGIEYHVDHIIPLRGKSVCGLHVPWNLRVITAKENRIKSNRIL